MTVWYQVSWGEIISTLPPSRNRMWSSSSDAWERKTRSSSSSRRRRVTPVRPAHFRPREAVAWPDANQQRQRDATRTSFPVQIHRSWSLQTEIWMRDICTVAQRYTLIYRNRAIIVDMCIIWTIQPNSGLQRCGGSSSLKYEYSWKLCQRRELCW